MNKLTSFAALAAAVLIGTLPVSALADEATSNEVSAPAMLVSTPTAGVVPGWYPPAYPGGYVQPWQQPLRRPAPPVYGQFSPRYLPGQVYPTFSAAPAPVPAARENPLSAELKRTEEQLSAKNNELDAANATLEELRAKLQESRSAEEALIEKLAHSERGTQALQVRAAEITEMLNTANATLGQQHQLINDHQAYNQQLTVERDQLRGVLAGRDEHLAVLQSELQAAMQALAEARSRADIAVDVLSAARVQVGLRRDDLSKLEAELQRQETRLQGDLQAPTE